jgi:16S rRNA (cytosine967-C5)-methyltransferase
MQAADPDSVFREFDRLGWAWSRGALLPGAVNVPLDSDVSGTQAFLSGRVEVQDIGSQLILESAGISPGGRWLDACAGSGGKTLQLASLLGPAGRVEARDARAAPLRELSVRAERAGLAGRIDIGARRPPPGGYDGVLVDAPCTGSGTWRRSPHLRWVTTPEGVRRASAVQLALLRGNSALVRPGGLLVYATCSLCRSENEAVAAAFLDGEPGFEAAVAGKRLWPQDHDGDGFFFASFRRLSPPAPAAQIKPSVPGAAREPRRGTSAARARTRP